MRSMIQSAADVIYNSSLEIMCPNLRSSELEAIVQFLYSGKISCSDEVFANQVSNSLKELFGFPLSESSLEEEKLCQKSDDILEIIFDLRLFCIYFCVQMNLKHVLSLTKLNFCTF